MRTGIPVRSEKKDKKFKVKTPSGKVIHFGNSLYEDFTQHKDEKRRKSYCARSAGIRNKQGKLTKDNKESANYYARRHLWFC
jgi:TFIIF-interacting CTD phosphatase-like protein